MQRSVRTMLPLTDGRLFEVLKERPDQFVFSIIFLENLPSFPFPRVCQCLIEPRITVFAIVFSFSFQNDTLIEHDFAMICLSCMFPGVYTRNCVMCYPHVYQRRSVLSLRYPTGKPLPRPSARQWIPFESAATTATTLLVALQPPAAP